MLSAQHIFFNSDNATSKNALGNQCHFELERAIYLAPHVRSYITLKMFRYSNVFYNIRTDSNTLYTTTGNYTVPQGAYSVQTLITALALVGITMTYDAVTLKASIRRTDNTSFAIQSGANSMHISLGFQITGVNQVTHLAENIVRLGGIGVLNITLNNMRIESNTTRNSTITHCIASIPNAVKTGAINTYVPQAGITYQTHERNIGSIDIHIYDENGNDVNFNGSSFYIAMQMTFEIMAGVSFVNPLQGGAIEFKTLGKNEPPIADPPKAEAKNNVDA